MVMSRKVFHRLVDYREVLNIVEKYVRLSPKGIEEVPIEDAIGRILASDVYAPSDVPPFDRSLVDGYAVCALDVARAQEDRPVPLRVIARIGVASQPPTFSRGECVEVATGAPIPYPADAVVPVEYCDEVSNDTVFIRRRVAPGENIDFAASDVVRGQLLAEKGTVITPAHVALFAATGIRKVKVFQRVRVAIIATGREIRPPGTELEPWCIYDVDTYLLASLLTSRRCFTYVLKGIVPDEVSKLKAVLDEVLDEVDAVLIIAGTSAGVDDITYRVLSQYEPGIVAHGVKLRPGKPTIVAVVGDKVVFGLPGFPVSCYIAYRLVVEPVLMKLAGARFSSEGPTVRARLLTEVRGIIGFRRVVPVVVSRRGNELLAYPIPIKSSSIAHFLSCDGFILTEPSTEVIKRGTLVDVILINQQLSISDVLYIGSHCPLAERVLRKVLGPNVKLIYVGSLGGLRALLHGGCDVAGSHLLDPETMEYNVPYVRRLGLRDVVVVRGYVREQGFIFRRDLAGKVNSFRDIVDLGLRFVNRNRGSGTRVLIEEILRKEAEELGMEPQELASRIKGFHVEFTTHEAVAIAIAQGRADVGFGIRYVAEKYGLGFKYVADEVFDLVISRSAMSEKYIRNVVEFMGSSAFKELIREYSGYKVHRDTGTVIFET